MTALVQVASSRCATTRGRKVSSIRSLLQVFVVARTALMCLKATLTVCSVEEVAMGQVVAHLKSVKLVCLSERVAEDSKSGVVRGCGVDSPGQRELAVQ